MNQTEPVVIRHADLDDFYRVQKFLAEYWDDGNHIFVRSSEYFKYFQIVDGCFNVYLGEGKISKKIYGICAYVICNRLQETDVQLNLLRVIKNNNFFDSLQLLDYMKKDLNCRIFSACGVRPKVKVIYDFQGYYTGKLDHYYRLADKEEYKIAVVKKKNIPQIEGGKYSLRSLPSFEDFKARFNTSRYRHHKPYKDDWCIEHRYYKSMARTYQVYGIDKGKDVYDSIIVLREVCHNNAKICKIVDFIGLDEDIGELSSEFQRLIDENDYEYIDFYCTGISHSIMEKAGFILRTSDDENIIPQLFEPFVQANKDIYFFTNDINGFHMYRGDSDQDRANIIK